MFLNQWLVAAETEETPPVHPILQHSHSQTGPVDSELSVIKSKGTAYAHTNLSKRVHLMVVP